MKYSDLADTFIEQGYLVVEDFFDAGLMEEMDDLIRGHFSHGTEYLHDAEFIEKSRAEVIPWFPQNDGVALFDAIDKDPALASLTEEVLGTNWSSQYCMVMFSKQGTAGQAWHQDCSPEKEAVFNLNRLVYTSDITDAVGGQTVVVPGSHRRGLLPAGNPVGEFDDQVVLRPGRGTLVLLHGHTWHRVLPVKGRYRYSTNYRAAPAGVPDDVTDVCVYRNMRYRFSTAEVIEERGPA